MTKSRMIIAPIITLSLFGCDMTTNPLTTTVTEERTQTESSLLIDKKITERIQNQINKIKQQEDILVATVETTTIITRSEKETFFQNISWLPTINGGKSTVKIRLEGNKVQYKIPSRSISYKLTKEGNYPVVVVTAQKPSIDKEVVEIQTQPSKVSIESDIGWSNLTASKTKELTDKIYSIARDEIIKSAQRDTPQTVVNEKADKAIKGLFYPLLQAIDKNIILRVEITQ